MKHLKDYTDTQIVLMFFSKHYPLLIEKVIKYIIDNKTRFSNKKGVFYRHFNYMCERLGFKDYNLKTFEYYTFLLEYFDIENVEEVKGTIRHYKKLSYR